MGKSLLNNLLGRFGMSLEKPITELLSHKTFDEKALAFKITSHISVSEDKVLASYINKLDPYIINSHNLDILKLLTKYKDNEVQPLNATSVGISAAVTAYGRIHISKIKQFILEKGGNIYYSDTDSIVTDIELPKDRISPTEIGKLKLLHEISKGIFLSGKM